MSVRLLDGKGRLNVVVLLPLSDSGCLPLRRLMHENDKPKPSSPSTTVFLLPSSLLTPRFSNKDLRNYERLRTSKQHNKTVILLLAHASDGAGFFSRFWLEETREGETVRSYQLGCLPRILTFAGKGRRGKSSTAVARPVLRSQGHSSPPSPPPSPNN